MKTESYNHLSNTL